MADRRAGMGWMDGGVHCFPIRVYYEDTDAQGMVYHAEVTATRGAVLSLNQDILRPPAPTPLVAMTLDLACLNAQGRPRRLPPFLHQALDAPPSP